MKHTHTKMGSQDRPPDVLEHLADSLQTGWKRYRKKLRRCQQSFSEEAVHQSRVETRRLISTVELLGAFIPERELERARRSLKQHLDTFDELRDTQVQLIYVGRLAEMFEAARNFQDWLRKREAKFTRRTRKAVKQIKTRRLGKRIATFQTEISRRRKTTTTAHAFDLVQRAMNRAFGRVARLCENVRASDTETIHRTRVAFKRFRYMVEALSPLLRTVNERYRQAMRGYQSMMGDIQDVEVLLAAFNKFEKKRTNTGESTRLLKSELQRRRKWLIRVYLNASEKLREFWPPPGLAQDAKLANRTL